MIEVHGRQCCPRRVEDGRAPRSAEEPMNALSNESDRYRQDDSCSYCGSLNPDIFMRHLEDGAIELGSTDKNYKVYVEGLTHPEAGQPCILSSTSFDPRYSRNSDEADNLLQRGFVLVTAENIDTLPMDASQKKHWRRMQEDQPHRQEWVKVQPRPPARHAKFYFQHLSMEQRTRFIELYNEQRIKFSGGYGFYVMPFFCKRA